MLMLGTSFYVREMSVQRGIGLFVKKHGDPTNKESDIVCGCVEKKGLT